MSRRSLVRALLAGLLAAGLLLAAAAPDFPPGTDRPQPGVMR